MKTIKPLPLVVDGERVNGLAGGYKFIVRGSKKNFITVKKEIATNSFLNSLSRFVC
jgi:hypothetical protein